MKKTIIHRALAAVVGLPLAIVATAAHADEFTKQDLERWQAQFMLDPGKH
jgi:hypothetical protein